MVRVNSPAELKKLRQEILSRRNPDKLCITLCCGPACHASDSGEVAAVIEDELEKQALKEEVDFRRTGCHGFCEEGPIVVIYPEGICYMRVTPEDIPEIIAKTIIEKEVVERLLYMDPSNGERLTHESEIPFYNNQMQLIFGPNRKIDPRSIEDYLAIGGYQSLIKTFFEMKPEEVIEEIKKAKLRGRGGGGFPTGRKWEFCRNAQGDVKYLVVNCDEGDPGAYMDRGLMEGNPHSVFEGLIIGAYAIGAHEGYIYVRQEYPITVENVNIALQQAGEYGLLGENILDSGFNFNIEVHRGAGAFVSGEETGLINALQGRPGEPKPRPPYPAVKGLWDKPTNINNVETWANVPYIINNGAEHYASIGTEGSKGTKIFSLVGKVNNTGLVEVPMGVSLRHIIYNIGGGIPRNKKFKAVQTGGPSGGCIPEEFLDIAVDYDELAKLGSIMGSGGLIVMDEDTCVVDVARYFIDFLCGESCGKCVPCREGLQSMRKILNRIVAGEGKEEDIDHLKTLARLMSLTSLCALGKTAPNPVLTTIQYFEDEFRAHIEEKRCPALVCKELISYDIDPDKCKACMICIRNCPADAIIGGKNQIHVIDQDKCTKCGTCLDVCPSRFGAVRKTSGESVPPPENKIVVGV
ncbi:NADH-ubiquinone oxidoreductase-F iron-sulfur binding region domain-containing protein [Chloroflexota bacterium]